MKTEPSIPNSASQPNTVFQRAYTRVKNTVRKHKLVVGALLVAGAAITGGISDKERQESKYQQHLEHEEAVSKRMNAKLEAARNQQAVAQRDAFERWSNLEPMDEFVKNNPEKKFAFYFEHAARIESDPTGENDGDNRTGKQRVFDLILADISDGKYTPKDIGTTAERLKKERSAN